uniref:RRM domain-containing protein n=1 Tax=Panagrolaimus superbus TaxID=310955 RepID=A0A914ZC87_9BILA
MSMQDNQHQDNSNGSPNGENKDSLKGNEDRKIFVGGIAYDVTNEDLSSHFATFGEVVQAQVKFDRTTGRSRGFAFVEFGTAEGCKKALNQKEQSIKGKQVEVKAAKSRENKKVFVGGLPADYPEEELRSHFASYGKVEDVEWPYDKVTKSRRNFAFIVFEEEDSADRAAAIARQTFGTRECDVKKAVPQSKRFNQMTRTMGGMRGGFTNGIRGNAMAMQNPQGWIGQNWNQMGAMPYAAGAGAAWNDWYSNQANFYPQNSTGGANYASANGYDYSQAQTANRPQQAATGAAAARYPQQY